jgi:DNA-binding CsgD family transcriptional regulator
MIAGLKLPHGSGDEIAAVTRYQRVSAEAEVAAAFLELDLTADMRPIAPRVDVPALVLHRRGDRVVPIRHGRELASLLPNGRFVGLNGDAHLPQVGDQRELQRALAGFLHDEVPVATNGDSPLSRRETEVLRLVAVGLSNREIASSLVLSEHTVHRHVANILQKLAQSSRAGAAAHATRVGFI